MVDVPSFLEKVEKSEVLNPLGKDTNFSTQSG